VIEKDCHLNKKLTQSNFESVEKFRELREKIGICQIELLIIFCCNVTKDMLRNSLNNLFSDSKVRLFTQMRILRTRTELILITSNVTERSTPVAKLSLQHFHVWKMIYFLCLAFDTHSLFKSSNTNDFPSNRYATFLFKTCPGNRFSVYT